MHSVGYKISYQSTIGNGEIELLDYNINDKQVFIKCNNKTGWIRTSALKNGECLAKIYLNVPNIVQLHNVGDIIESKKIKYPIKITAVGIRKEKDKNETVVYQVMCKNCKNISWSTQQRLTEFYCRYCSERAKPLDICNITITHPWAVKYFQGGIDEAKQYTHGSSVKINPICPYCGKIKKTALSICSLIENHGFQCSCSDHNSFSEKYVCGLLTQLNVDFVFQQPSRQLGLDNTNNRYDFYIPSKKLILETHGKQHYSHNRNSKWISLEKQKEKDKYKKEIAQKAGIKYIELDCRKSTIAWIKDSVMKSELPSLFSFSEKDVDWVKCADFYQNNLVKTICNDYRENYLTVKELMDKYHMSKYQISYYLKRGDDIGWCLFDKYFNTNNKPIEALKEGKHIAYARNATVLAKNSKKLLGKTIHNTHIYNCLNEKWNQYNGFQFKYVKDIPLKWEIMKNERMMRYEH